MQILTLNWEQKAKCDFLVNKFIHGITFRYKKFLCFCKITHEGLTSIFLNSAEIFFHRNEKYASGITNENEMQENSIGYTESLTSYRNNIDTKEYIEIIPTQVH